MDDNKQLHNELYDKIATAISKVLRYSINIEERLFILKSLSPQPDIKSLGKINEIGINNEDFETCEAIKYMQT